MKYLSKVRVKRKGQLTIPLGIGSKLDIEEGTLMEIRAEDGAIVLTPIPRLEAEKPVGVEENKRILAELDALRRKWR